MKHASLACGTHPITPMHRKHWREGSAYTYSNPLRSQNKLSTYNARVAHAGRVKLAHSSANPLAGSKEQ